MTITAAILPKFDLIITNAQSPNRPQTTPDLAAARGRPEQNLVEERQPRQPLLHARSVLYQLNSCPLILRAIRSLIFPDPYIQRSSQYANPCLQIQYLRRLILFGRVHLLPIEPNILHPHLARTQSLPIPLQPRFVEVLRTFAAAVGVLRVGNDPQQLPHLHQRRLQPHLRY